jgi:hypothetical protein
VPPPVPPAAADGAPPAAAAGAPPAAAAGAQPAAAAGAQPAAAPGADLPALAANLSAQGRQALAFLGRGVVPTRPVQLLPGAANQGAARAANRADQPDPAPDPRGEPARQAPADTGDPLLGGMADARDDRARLDQLLEHQNVREELRALVERFLRGGDPGPLQKAPLWDGATHSIYVQLLGPIAGYLLNADNQGSRAIVSAYLFNAQMLVDGLCAHVQAYIGERVTDHAARGRNIEVLSDIAYGRVPERWLCIGPGSRLDAGQKSLIIQVLIVGYACRVLLEQQNAVAPFQLPTEDTQRLVLAQASEIGNTLYTRCGITQLSHALRAELLRGANLAFPLPAGRRGNETGPAAPPNAAGNRRNDGGHHNSGGNRNGGGNRNDDRRDNGNGGNGNRGNTERRDGERRDTHGNNERPRERGGRATAERRNRN